MALTLLLTMTSACTVLETQQTVPEAVTQSAPATAAEIGSTLQNKVAVPIDAVPEEVMAVARAARPDLDFQKAERVERKGVVYFDIERRRRGWQ